MRRVQPVYAHNLAQPRTLNLTSVKPMSFYMAQSRERARPPWQTCMVTMTFLQYCSSRSTRVVQRRERYDRCIKEDLLSRGSGSLRPLPFSPMTQGILRIPAELIHYVATLIDVSTSRADVASMALTCQHFLGPACLELFGNINLQLSSRTPLPKLKAHVSAIYRHDIRVTRINIHTTKAQSSRQHSKSPIAISVRDSAAGSYSPTPHIEQFAKLPGWLQTGTWKR